MILTYGDSKNGLVRKCNEDAIDLSAPGLFILADGMGGYEGGQIASSLAVKQTAAFLADKKEDFSEEAMKQAVLFANEEILRKKEKEPGLSSMGTTLEVAAMAGDQLFWAHVGDSRLYVWKDGELTQITEDHSYVMQLVREGKLSKDAMRSHPRKNEITRAVGIDSSLQVDTGTLTVAGGETLLLCSDGLTSMVTDEEISSLLAQSPKASKEELAALGEHLMQRVYEAGAKDNVSFILVQIGGVK